MELPQSIINFLRDNNCADKIIIDDDELDILLLLNKENYKNISDDVINFLCDNYIYIKYFNNINFDYIDNCYGNYNKLLNKFGYIFCSDHMHYIHGKLYECQKCKIKSCNDNYNDYCRACYYNYYY